MIQGDRGLSGGWDQDAPGRGPHNVLFLAQAPERPSHASHPSLLCILSITMPKKILVRAVSVVTTKRSPVTDDGSI